MLSLRPYQNKAIEDIRAFFNAGGRSCILQAPTGAGKCLAPGTEIIMFSGEIKKVEDLKPGDLLMGVDSKPRKIKSTTSGFETMYKIIPTKGEPFMCNESHILSLKITPDKKGQKHKIINIGILDFLSKSEYFKHRAKLWRTGVEFTKKKQHLIDPYVLGLWLGDGSSCCPSLTGSDAEIITYLHDWAAKNELSIRREILKNNKSDTFHFKSKIPGWHKNKLREALKELNLINNKHIPFNYKTGTREQRLKLLAGLLDTDGYYHNKGFEISTKFIALRDDILFLARSLGFAAYSRMILVKNKKYFVIYITGDLSIVPTKVKRKKAKPREQIRNPLVTGFKIERLKIGKYYGFELYGDDRLFLLKDFTVTHNTVIFTELARRVGIKGKKVLILTNRAELLLQAGGAVKRVGLEAFYIKAGLKIINHEQTVYVAMSQTLRRRVDLPLWREWLEAIDLVIIDEAHLQEFNYLFEKKLLTGKFIIGFTATPKRSGRMRQMAFDYEKIITTVTVKELIAAGYLVNDDYYGILKPNLAGVAFDRLKGDYKTGDLFKRFDDVKIYRGAVKNYKSIADGTKAIVFCVNIEHCIRTTQEFIEAGYRARFVASTLSRPKEPAPTASPGARGLYEERLRVFNLLQENKHLTGKRDDIFTDYAEGRFDILVNANIATMGFDAPGIETVIVLRATVSDALWLQIIGRGSRIAPGKTHFNILDFGGNAARLGTYTQERRWSLWHEASNGEGLPPLKVCGLNSNNEPIRHDAAGCRRPILASLKICPFCGFRYPDKKASKEIDLMPVFVNPQTHRAQKTKRPRDMTNAELFRYWRAKGHKTGWLWIQLWMRGGEKALREFAFEQGWRRSTTEKAVMYCKTRGVKIYG